MRRRVAWVHADGRTVGFEPAARDEELLDVVLLPGLVNAHAHLDLAGSGPVDAGGTFPDWLLRIGSVRDAGRDVGGEAAREADALARRGVVAAGDVDGSRGEGTRGRRRGGLGGRSYLEIVGVNAASARARLSEALRTVDLLGRGADELGLSPHAPYSLHEDVVPEIVRAARARGLPLAMHLAETEEETRYLVHGDGPFVGFLETIGRGAPFARAPGVRPIAYAEATGFLAAGGVVVHGNDLDDEDVGRLARHAATVVYCHGTHRHFGRPAHRLVELVDAGVGVAFGTDSGASNQEVDLFAELVRLRRDRPDVGARLVLEGATRAGRRALRLDDGPSTWSPGSSADACALGPVPEEAERWDAEELAAWAFSGDATPRFTVHGGRVRLPEEASPDRLVAQLDSLCGHG